MILGLGHTYPIMTKTERQFFGPYGDQQDIILLFSL